MTEQKIISAIDDAIQVISYLNEIDNFLINMRITEPVTCGSVDHHLQTRIKLVFDIIIDSLDEECQKHIFEDCEDHIFDCFFEVVYQIAIAGFCNHTRIDANGDRTEKTLFTAKDVYELFTDKNFIMELIKELDDSENFDDFESFNF